MSARSYGSVRRLKSLGTRSAVNGSAQIRIVPCAPLLHEHHLPVVEAQRDQIAVVVEVDEALARALLVLAGQVRQQIVAVDVDLERLARRLVALLELLDDVGLARHRQECRQPVVMLDDLVGDRRRPGSCRASAPCSGTRKAPSQFVSFSLRNGVMPPSGQVFMCGPLSVLYIDERVVGDAQLVQQVEHLAHVLVVVDHRVVVGRLPPAGLAEALRLGVGSQVHVGGVDPAEERLAGLVLALDEVLGGGDELVVAGLHALPGQRAGVLDLLLADPPPARLVRSASSLSVAQQCSTPRGPNARGTAGIFGFG